MSAQMMGVGQEEWDAPSPAEVWEQDVAQRALDDLFNATIAYRTSEAYLELMRFIGRFRFYAPFNAMLVHIQRPGAQFVAPPYRWKRDYGRTIKPGANPLVILQPMGPVMFVFDVADTEGETLPPEVEKPYEVRSGRVGRELPQTQENVKRDGVDVAGGTMGSQGAGRIGHSDQKKPKWLSFPRSSKQGDVEKVPVRYTMVLNRDLGTEAQYATLIHELAHLYCGHLGSPNPQWWPDRRGLSKVVVEFEAESVAYLICSRLGIENPSDAYLAGYTKSEKEVPRISLECVMKSAGLIESMGKARLKPRKA